ncbi:hypothetical protein QBC37DRAFT_379692 [Rhypophila decipiens]|uniref:Uncharacterized protein n=1 Tax=Rhypophila decipiens TaxID=261697 RepID=A0AAN7B4G4_9PEZI|nr:hypothetical protein QBC37DRAFT_379692 [Rhypophila decipiens]
MDDDGPAKIACLTAAIGLFNWKEDDKQFLPLIDATMNSDKPARPEPTMTKAVRLVRDIFAGHEGTYTLEEAEAAVEACKIVWPDAAFPKLDPELIVMLANSDHRGLKIPDSYFRGFLVLLADKTKQIPSRLFRKHEIFNKLHSAAWIKTKQVYGTHDLVAPVPDCYIRGGIPSNWILHHVKEAMDSIKAASDKTIESEKQALSQYDSLISEMLYRIGEYEGDSDIRDYYGRNRARTEKTLDTLKFNYDTLSQLITGSVNIIKGGDSKRSNEARVCQ